MESIIPTDSKEDNIFFVAGITPRKHFFSFKESRNKALVLAFV